MADRGPHYDYYKRARERQKLNEGIRAAYIGEVGERDRDGWVGKVVATDGREDIEFDVTVAGSEGGSHGMPVDGAAIAEIVESLSERCPVDKRLRTLAGSAPLRLSSVGDAWTRVMGSTRPE